MYRMIEGTGRIRLNYFLNLARNSGLMKNRFDFSMNHDLLMGSSAWGFNGPIFGYPSF